MSSLIIIASFLFAVLFIVVGILIWKACRKAKLKKSQEFIQELNNINNSNERIY